MLGSEEQHENLEKKLEKEAGCVSPTAMSIDTNHHCRSTPSHARKYLSFFITKLIKKCLLDPEGLTLKKTIDQNLSGMNTEALTKVCDDRHPSNVDQHPSSVD